MNGYTKLFSSILASTIWEEAKETKVLWITMLAMADKYGEVQSSIPGLATLARLTVDEVSTALKKLTGPDEYSRTKDYQGRRIEEVDGGWRILNHGKYREKMNAEEQRAKNAEYQARHRKKVSGIVSQSKPASADVSQVSTTEAYTESESESDSKSKAEAEAEAEAKADTKAKKRNTPAAPVDLLFDRFWQAFPKGRKTGKQKAKEAWQKASKLASPEVIIAAAAEYADSSVGNGEFVQMPTTWLNGGCWDDDRAGWEEKSKSNGRGEIPMLKVTDGSDR